MIKLILVDGRHYAITKISVREEGDISTFNIETFENKLTVQYKFTHSTDRLVECLVQVLTSVQHLLPDPNRPVIDIQEIQTIIYNTVGYIGELKVNRKEPLLPTNEPHHFYYAHVYADGSDEVALVLMPKEVGLVKNRAKDSTIYTMTTAFNQGVIQLVLDGYNKLFVRNTYDGINADNIDIFLNLELSTTLNYSTSIVDISGLMENYTRSCGYITSKVYLLK